MGKPGVMRIASSLAESIGQEKRTRGSETSQYPKEKKSTEILLVAASERGIGQTKLLRRFGVVGPEICRDD